MPRLVNSEAKLPSQLSFAPLFRSIDSVQSLQVFNANNSSIVTTANPQTITIKINSNKWMNGKSSYLKFGLQIQHSTGGKVGTLMQNVGTVFRRMTTLIGGRVIEIVDDHNVISRIIAESQANPASTSNWGSGYGPVADRLNTAAGGAITAVKNYTMQPLSGLLNSDELVPLWALSELEIRLELNDAFDSMFNSTDSVNLTSPIVTIVNPAYVCELHDLPMSLNNLTQNHINQVGLTYNMPSFDATQFNIQRPTSLDQTIANNAKSAKTVWFVQRTALNRSESKLDYDFIKDGLASFNLKIGGNWYPNEEITTDSWAWEELVKSFQREGHYTSNFNITQDEYNGDATPDAEGGNKAIYGIDLEKFCGSAQICGTDFSENEIVLKLTYGTAPAVADNTWYFFTYRDATLTILPNFNTAYNY